MRCCFQCCAPASCHRPASSVHPLGKEAGGSGVTVQGSRPRLEERNAGGWWWCGVERKYKENLIWYVAKQDPFQHWIEYLSGIQQEILN